MHLASLTFLSVSKHNGLTPRNTTASETTAMSCKHETRTKQGYEVRSQPNSCARQRKKGKDHESFLGFTYLKAKTSLVSQAKEIHRALAEDFSLSCGMEKKIVSEKQKSVE